MVIKLAEVSALQHISIIASFCNGCLVKKQPEEMSCEDPRFCKPCHDLLLAEYQALEGRQKYKPPPLFEKAYPGTPLECHSDALATRGHNSEKVKPIPSYGLGKKQIIMSHFAEAKILKKRGPKHRDVPEHLIKQLAANQILKPRGIARVMLSEHQTKISYKTVERILKGQRVLV